MGGGEERGGGGDIGVGALEGEIQFEYGSATRVC
jgi:hypothetical protein